MEVFPVLALGSWSEGSISAVRAVRKGLESRFLPLDRQKPTSKPPVTFLRRTLWARCFIAAQLFRASRELNDEAGTALLANAAGCRLARCPRTLFEYHP